MRGLRITEPWNAARQAASNTEGIALDRIGLIQVDFPENALTTEVERGKIAFTVGIIFGINRRRGDSFEQFDLAHEDVSLGLVFGLVTAAKVVEHSVGETDAGRGV